MAMSLPERLRLAQLPTPLERFPIVDLLGLDLWVKRDDLTESALSGNKVRKLEFLAAEAAQRGTDVLITCGAVTSNHARATALVAARLGWRSHLLLRGEEPHHLTGNLLLERFVGAEATFISVAEWTRRAALMDEIAAGFLSRGHRPYVIPEGGSNAMGALGYAVAAAEVLEQAGRLDLNLVRIVHATGSGGTTAGLAMGLAAAGREDVDVIGVAVCADGAFFDRKVAEIVDEAVARGFLPRAVGQRARWRILDAYQGPGYGRVTETDLHALADLSARTGLIFDPVYTGKALLGLLAEARAGGIGDGATLFLHTGGLLGLFDFAGQVGAIAAKRR